MSLVPETLPTPERLLDLIDAFGGLPIAVFADLVADQFIYGTPKRISREAPVLILHHERDELVPGGGANAVANIAALGGRPWAFGAIGADASGRLLLEKLHHRGAAIDGIEVVDAYRTPTKTRVVAGGRHAIKQQIVRFDVEDQLSSSPAFDRRRLDDFVRLAGSARVAVLSDYGYGAVTPELLVSLRHERPDLMILGDSRYRLAELKGLDGATPNLEEAEKILGGSFDGGSAELDAGGQRLRAELGSRFVLITRGSAGMSLFDARGASHLPVHGTDQVADVTGAGDTVIGTFALALAAGASPLEAACLANYAGGVVVMKVGTATLSCAELKSAIQHDPELLQTIVQRANP